MPETPHDAMRDANERAWDYVASKYEPDVQRDVDRLRSGTTTLLPVELEMLSPLLPACSRAIHLQCSHGNDALSLWRLGVAEVIGIDISARMLAIARRKTELLGANAAWYHGDVLSPPESLSATADLVYTGKGALPWVLELAAWARVVARLLAAGGHFYILEGHPLNWVWDPNATTVQLRPDADYFARAARVNDDFPGRYLERAAREPLGPLPAFERQWNLGEVVSALVDAGLLVVRLVEHAEHFWPQFPSVSADDLRRLPHTFSLLMRKPA